MAHRWGVRHGDASSSGCEWGQAPISHRRARGRPPGEELARVAWEGSAPSGRSPGRTRAPRPETGPRRIAFTGHLDDRRLQTIARHGHRAHGVRCAFALPTGSQRALADPLRPPSDSRHHGSSRSSRLDWPASAVHRLGDGTDARPESPRIPKAMSVDSSARWRAIAARDGGVCPWRPKYRGEMLSASTTAKGAGVMSITHHGPGRWRRDSAWEAPETTAVDKAAPPTHGVRRVGHRYGHGGDATRTPSVTRRRP